MAWQYQNAVARRYLTDLVESLRKLHRRHTIALLILSYRRLEYWIDWQAGKHGIPVAAVEPRGTSNRCPICNLRLVENGHRKMSNPRCGVGNDTNNVVGGSLTLLAAWRRQM